MLMTNSYLDERMKREKIKTVGFFVLKIFIDNK